MNQIRNINNMGIGNTKVFFKDVPHIYETEDGQRLTSVSAVISRHKKPFDRGVMSLRVAKRDGREQHEVLADWRRKKDISLLLGNYLHESLYIGLLNPEAVKDKAMLNIIEQVRAILPMDHEIFREQMLADVENKIAGTADLVTQQGNECVIWDYKTNEILGKPSYSNFLAPLQHLEQSKINEYAVQLNLYKYLKELENVKVTGLKIINILNGVVKVIEVEPLDREIQLIIK